MAAFHFMGTNKRIKKPFCRDEWEAEEVGRGAALQNRTRRKEDRKQEGQQTEMVKAKVTPPAIMSGSFKKPSPNCLELKMKRGKGKI